MKLGRSTRDVSEASPTVAEVAMAADQVRRDLASQQPRLSPSERCLRSSAANPASHSGQDRLPHLTRSRTRADPLAVLRWDPQVRTEAPVPNWGAAATSKEGPAFEIAFALRRTIGLPPHIASTELSHERSTD